MASFSCSKALAFFILFNIAFFTCVSSDCVPCQPPPKPPSCPPPPMPPSHTPPAPPPKEATKCPKDTLKFGVCGSWLGLVHEVVGTPPSKECCALISGLADLEAAVCLCTAIKANVLGVLKVEVPVAISLIVNSCGKKFKSKLNATGTFKLMPKMLALMAVQRQTAASRSARPPSRLQQGAFAGQGTTCVELTTVKKRRLRLRSRAEVAKAFEVISRLVGLRLY
ncbi:Hydrophobic seed protein domain [Dillenia turbinata]|uniref:Hydrophobic seed protein domain n=1 Tax=Dillenia turbinata TaxID=194707 RepID=A0AAN8UYE6_9MAGN